MEPLPTESVAAANGKSRRLRELIRAPEILVMPGAHDVVSALLYESLGFEAVQGSSAAIAWARGYPDGEVIGLERTVAVTGEMAAALSVPVNADGEAGYGDANQVPETVRAFVEAGAAGMNLEDSRRDPERRLAEVPEQLEMIAAVMEAKRALGSEFFLNARVDALMLMAGEPDAALREAVQRGNAYAEAGADCIFFLNAGDRERIATLVKEVAAPASVFALPDTPSVRDLEAIGVARVSYGSAFLLVALGALKRFAAEIREKGEHQAMMQALPPAEMRELLRRSRVGQ